MRLLITRVDDRPRKKVGLQHQITENERLNEQLQDANRRLEALAIADEVTGIANRRGLNMHVDRLLDSSEGTLQLSLIMIDIDYFKEYNDLYGHEQGDSVLAAVATVLEKIAQTRRVSSLGGAAKSSSTLPRGWTRRRPLPSAGESKKESV